MGTILLAEPAFDKTVNVAFVSSGLTIWLGLWLRALFDGEW